MERLVAITVLLLYSLTMSGQEFKAYQEGERLKYVIHYRFGPIRSDVGEAETLLTKESNQHYGDHYKAIISGSSYPFYDLFFKIRDLFESHFSIEDGRPYYFFRDIREGRYTMINHHHYNGNSTINASIQRKSAPVRDSILTIDKKTFDLVSLYYNYRNTDTSTLEIGVNTPLKFAIDLEVHDVYFRFLGREEKRIPGIGRFKTLKFALKLVTGEVFTGKDELIVWFSDDDNRIPLLFESPILVGKVRGRLSEFENLKYPLSSFIQ